MPSSSFSGTEQARKSVAKRLQDLRKDAGLTVQGLADLCGWNKAKTSRIENVRTLPSGLDIRAWCEACGAEEQAADLIAASRHAESLYVEWRRKNRTGMRRLQDDAVPLYERTERFRSYCSRVIPGLLQTEHYAYELLGSVSTFRQVPNDAREAARARVKRSEILHQRGHSFAFLIEEHVLYFQHGEAATMVEQLDYLSTVTRLPNVSLGVIPRAAPRAMWGQETFLMLDDQVAVELLTAEVTITQPSEVHMYARMFAELSLMAQHGAQARHLIDTARHSFG
ncbi:helix-turn-helix domain-containing protein [Streptomyces sp. NPDC059819]|uniref:helix-turn-helix domain-containing protein n=1 Tax=Streptomyces sp. NPDC059819 TaxID=3346963 RepID=UPI00364E4B23